MREKLLHPLRNLVAAVIHYIRGREPILLVTVLVAVLGMWGFVELADEVIEGSTGEFDRWAVRQLRQPDDPSQAIGPPWMAEVGRDLTGLGGVAVLTLFIAASAGFLAIHRARRTMAVLLASTIGGIVVSLLLKRLFDRPRPDIVPHLSDVYTSSFPSGHSMMSAVVYLTLGALVAPVLKHFWLRFYVMMLAIVVTAMIGCSRVYMGVHYPTDVLAGWTAGLVWALLCWMIARSFRGEKKTVELATKTCESPSQQHPASEPTAAAAESVDSTFTTDTRSNHSPNVRSERREGEQR